MKTIQIISSVVFILATGIASAGPGMHEPYTGSPEFEKMKQLAGTWQGTSVMQGKDQDVTISYQVTSAGSAVVERHFPGTPGEMVSVYHDDGNKLSMTHYCALKNQPVLGLKNSTADTIALDFTGGSNIDPEKDAHMHSLTITFVDDDHIVEQWAMYNEGKRVESSPIKLARVKTD